VSVLIALSLTLFVGGVSLLKLPLEIMPAARGRGIQIIAHWKQYSPEIIQQTLTAPLEKMASQLSGVSSIQSSSGIGVAFVKLNFPQDADLTYAYLELRETLAALRNQLPQDVTIKVEPVFEREEALQQFKQPFFELELNGPFSARKLRHLAEQIVIPSLKTIDGIANLELFGGSQSFIEIQSKRSAPAEESANISDKIARHLRAYSQSIRAGLVENYGERLPLELERIVRGYSDLSQVPVGKGPILGEISTISFTYKPPQTLYRRNGQPLVYIRIFKAPGVNALSLSGRLREKLEQINERLPANVRLMIAHDGAEQLSDELKSLALRSAIIMGMVFLILFLLFRRWLISLLVLFIIVFSILSAAIFLFFTNYTLNLVTLAGIALVFGMLVDNAVVVVENIQRYRSLGKSPFASALRGTMEVGQPLLASSATTILVFMALLFLEKRLGTYYAPMALALAFSLTASLFWALTMVPAIAVRWPRLLTDGRGIFTQQRLKTLYSRLELKILKRHKLILGGAVVLLAVSTMAFWKYIDQGGFLFWAKPKDLVVQIIAPRGIVLSELDKIARWFESTVLGFQTPVNVQTVVNAAQAYAEVRISFPDSLVEKGLPQRLKRRLTTDAVNFAGVGIGIYGYGPPFWNEGAEMVPRFNTFLQIYGPDYDRLRKLCNSILKMVKNDPRVGRGLVSPSIRSITQGNYKEFRLQPDFNRLWNAGHSITWAREMIIEPLLGRETDQQLELTGFDYPVKITSNSEFAKLGELLNNDGITTLGEHFELSRYFRFSRRHVEPWIDKQNQQYRFTVAWEYLGPERMRADFKKRVINSLSLPPGYGLVKKNWSFLTAEEQHQLLRLLGVVSVGSYMILAALYENILQPFIILMSFPFSLIGVFLAYILSGKLFNANGYVGLIILVGIVVNNAIVLVERINQLRRKGVKLEQAVIQGASDRIRPILITTLTTIGGLLPLLFLKSESSSTLAMMLKELSFITVVGLVSSGFFSLTLIPAIYYLIGRRIPDSVAS